MVQFFLVLLSFISYSISFSIKEEAFDWYELWSPVLCEVKFDNFDLSAGCCLQCNAGGEKLNHFLLTIL